VRSGEHGGQVLLVWIGDEEQRGGFVVSMRCRVGGEIEAGGGGCREMGELIGQGRPWWQRGSEGGGSGRGEVEAVIARGTLVLLK